MVSSSRTVVETGAVVGFGASLRLRDVAATLTFPIFETWTFATGTATMEAEEDYSDISKTLIKMQLFKCRESWRGR